MMGMIGDIQITILYVTIADLVEDVAECQPKKDMMLV
jgi:hypothetical protein